ncbi:hypothetical protein H5410_031789 [Solanum commersonii]|uniref:CobN/magnesium chelatase domain-containing protein n=1 Tax=Solanum commersonii TaxID=4109 RepID=A0A9J5YI55_SOLCO|nr:hypothetical protein H5410_031789 [Solanum commersonii]
MAEVMKNFNESQNKRIDSLIDKIGNRDHYDMRGQIYSIIEFSTFDLYTIEQRIKAKRVICGDVKNMEIVLRMGELERQTMMFMVRFDELLDHHKADFARESPSYYKYFDSSNFKNNLMKDGIKPSAYIADATTANAQTVRLDARTKLLNPKWYEGMLSTGYEGVCEIEKRLTNTVGWSANEHESKFFQEVASNIEKLKRLYSEVEDKIEGIDR